MGSRVAVWGVGVLMLTTAGCAHFDLADDLNKRHGRGCYSVRGIYAPFVAVNAFLATGGETVSSCLGNGAWPTQGPAHPLERAAPGQESPATCRCEE